MSIMCNVANSLDDVNETKVKRVQFECADIIEFEPTVYTATVTSGGVPVGLSKSVRRRCRRRLDSYESEQSKIRVSREDYMERGYLHPEERIEILESTGHSTSSFISAEKEVNRIINERMETNDFDLSFHVGLGEAHLIYEEEPDAYMFAEDDDEDMYSCNDILMNQQVCVEMDEMDQNDSKYQPINNVFPLFMDDSDYILYESDTLSFYDELPYADFKTSSSFSSSSMSLASSCGVTMDLSPSPNGTATTSVTS